MKDIVFAGHMLSLHPSGALFWPARRMLIAADLHLEKGSHYAARGYFLPPYDTHKTLLRLLDVIREMQAENLLILGDCFHDPAGYERLSAKDRDLFGKLGALKPLWIRGNHDGDFVPPGFASHDAYEMDGLVFRHEAAPGAEGEISGHFHPKALIAHRGERIARPCFIEDGKRLILPAFGTYTGGLFIDDPAIASLFGDDVRLYLLGRHKIFALHKAGLY